MTDEPVTDRPDELLAARLVEQAHADGVDLVGPDGLLAGITKRVLETGLEVEMSEHLGYDKHATEGRNGGNSRTGMRSKPVATSGTRFAVPASDQTAVLRVVRQPSASRRSRRPFRQAAP